jgi:hypothetical protein
MSQGDGPNKCNMVSCMGSWGRNKLLS